MDQTNAQDDDIELRSSSNEGFVDQLRHQTTQKLEKNSDKQNEKSQHRDKVDSNATLLKSANQNTDNMKKIPGNPHKSNDNTACKGHLEKDASENDEHGAKKQTTDETEAKRQTSSRSRLGRVIMIDGIKFVAVTCLQPPKGNCRTCSTFGSLLYFSARSCYILEAAEKFCSVQCARKFINEKRYHLTPSRQPSGDVGSNVSIPYKQFAPTDQIYQKDYGTLSKDTDSGARDGKTWKRVTKSKPASHSVGTIESIYVDSSTLKKEDKSRKPKKGTSLKKQGIYQSHTPPLTSRWLSGSDLKSTSNSDTSVSEKSYESTKTSTSCELNLCPRKDMENSVPKKRGRRKKGNQKANSSKGQEYSTPPIAKQERRNLTRGSPSGSNKKIWKKYGAKFRSRSCEFHQPAVMRVPRGCDTPDPSSKGLVTARGKDSCKKGIDIRMSLNQFHERRRSLFKTLFPFQDTLGSLGAEGPGKGPGEKTPSETSVIEDCGDVYTSSPQRMAPESPNPVLSVSKVGSKAKTNRHADCKTSHKIKYKSDKRNADTCKTNSNWTNLFQFMIEAADREELERKQEVNDCDEHHNATSANQSILRDAVLCTTETTRSMAYPVSRLSDDATEEVRIQDNQIGEEQRKKKKKKKKKRKRKKEKRSIDENDVHDARTNPDVDNQKQPDTPLHGRRKGKDKKRRARRNSGSPSSPGSQEDPNDWPKWRGDGRHGMDMMTSVDRLMWTMKNSFQPNILDTLRLLE